MGHTQLGHLELRHQRTRKKELDECYGFGLTSSNNVELYLARSVMDSRKRSWKVALWVFGLVFQGCSSDCFVMVDNSGAYAS